MFVVAGDKGAPDGPYADALSIINSGLLAHYGVRHVSIAGYPEGHPTIDEGKLWAALRDKVDALQAQGLSVSILTQFGFNTEPVFAWLEQLRERGIDAPVRLGIPGPASAATLMKFAARCGVVASTSMLKKFGLTLTRLRQSSGPDLYVHALMDRLNPQAHGQVGLHFYPFGGLVNTARWIEEFDRTNCG
jgi:methylenetetrahydrofolate reductase (NADPH)